MPPADPRPDQQALGRLWAQLEALRDRHEVAVEAFSELMEYRRSPDDPLAPEGEREAWAQAANALTDLQGGDFRDIRTRVGAAVVETDQSRDDGDS